ncbi:MAG: hypothetical protein MZV70_49035 [Desulfobacterales bacterium]|nr:hypothetical protein [Desulfobacterales bacterium]
MRHRQPRRSHDADPAKAEAVKTAPDSVGRPPWPPPAAFPPPSPIIQEALRLDPQSQRGP